MTKIVVFNHLGTMIYKGPIGSAVPWYGLENNILAFLKGLGYEVYKLV